MKRTLAVLVILLLATPSWAGKLDIDPMGPKPMLLAKADNAAPAWRPSTTSKVVKKKWMCPDCGHDDVAFAVAVEVFVFLLTMAIRSEYLR